MEACPSHMLSRPRRSTSILDGMATARHCVSGGGEWRFVEARATMSADRDISVDWPQAVAADLDEPLRGAARRESRLGSERSDDQCVEIVGRDVGTNAVGRLGAG